MTLCLMLLAVLIVHVTYAADVTCTADVTVDQVHAGVTYGRVFVGTMHKCLSAFAKFALISTFICGGQVRLGQEWVEREGREGGVVEATSVSSICGRLGWGISSFITNVPIQEAHLDEG